MNFKKTAILAGLFLLVLAIVHIEDQKNDLKRWSSVERVDFALSDGRNVSVDFRDIPGNKVLNVIVEAEDNDFSFSGINPVNRSIACAVDAKSEYMAESRTKIDCHSTALISSPVNLSGIISGNNNMEPEGYAILVVEKLTSIIDEVRRQIQSQSRAPHT